MTRAVAATHSRLVNPLATSRQLATSASQVDGIPKDIEDVTRFQSAWLAQIAGILLHLPEETIAQSIVLMQRYWVSPDGGSILDHDLQDVIAASLYLAAKPSESSRSPRQVIVVSDFLAQAYDSHGHSITSKLDDFTANWQLTEGSYEIRRDHLYAVEAAMLRTLGFNTHVALPYSLCVNYLQTLDVFQGDGAEGVETAKRAFAHLNTALLSPQLLYLTHQPSAIATASIYLAAREVGAALPDVEWWEVFDVDREELGFLVVALQSTQDFAREKVQTGINLPLTVDALRMHLDRLDTQN